MIAPVSIAVSSALQVSVAATGALAQATVPHFVPNFSDFSLPASAQGVVPTFTAPALWSPTSHPQSDISEDAGLLEEVTPWAEQDAGLGTRILFAVDSNPLAQAGIALVATGATILAARLARHRIASLAHRGWEGINRGRAWVGQRWQQVHFSLRKNWDLTDTRSVPPVAVPSPQPSPAQGDSINPKMIPGFTIETNAAGELIELGKGGMGVVYLARPDSLGRHRVAIKLITDEALRSSSSIKDRFLREALAMEVIRHQNVVGIENVGETKDGRPYIVMEYVDGGTMADWGQKLRTRLDTGSLSMRDYEREVAGLFVQIADGVTTIHNARDERGVTIGLIHRDLKPSNVFLTQGGVPKIADFGIVRWLDGHHTPLTEAGQTLGTPQFLPPEAVTLPITWSPKSDIYALGVMLFYVLTNRLPYSADNLRDLLLQVVGPDQPSPQTHQPQLSDEMAAIVEMAMAKNPADRHQSAEELRQDLENYLAAAATGSGAQLGDGDPLAEEFFRR